MATSRARLPPVPGRPTPIFAAAAGRRKRSTDCAPPWLPLRGARRALSLAMTNPASPLNRQAKISADEPPRFDLAFDAPGGPPFAVSPLVRRIVAPNPGPFTFTGTCTYVVGKARWRSSIPAPTLPAHVAALFAGLEGEKVAGASSPIFRKPSAALRNG